MSGSIRGRVVKHYGVMERSFLICMLVTYRFIVRNKYGKVGHVIAMTVDIFCTCRYRCIAT